MFIFCIFYKSVKDDVTATFTYQNGYSFTCTAGAATGAITNSTTNEGGSGGTVSSEEPSFGTCLACPGVNGASYNQAGTSNSYTSSGSGSNSTGTAAYGFNNYNYINPPSIQISLDNINFTNQGGGITVQPSGYGSGGCSVPTSYEPGTDNYILGTPATCLYYFYD